MNQRVRFKNIPVLVWTALNRRFRDPVARQRYFLAYCVGCVFGYVAYWFSRTSPGFPFGGPGDFTTFYTGALILRSGHPQQLYDLALQTQVQQSLLHPYGWEFQDGLLPYIYPPFFASIFIPLTYLPLQRAFHFWNVISLLLLLASMRLLASSGRSGGRPDHLSYALIVFAFFPVFEAFYKGQSIFLVLFFMTLGYVQLKKGWEATSGVCLGACLVKPQLVFVLALLLLFKRRWRVLAAFGVTALVLAGLSWLWVGTAGIRAYGYLSRSTLVWNGLYNFLPTRMPNLRGSVYRVAEAVGVPYGTESPVWTPLLVTAALSIGILAAVLHLWKGKWRTSGPVFDLQFCSTLMATMLLTPYLYAHDLSLLALAGLIAAPALARAGRGDQAARMVAGVHVALLISLFAVGSDGGAQVAVVVILLVVYYLGRQIVHPSSA